MTSTKGSTPDAATIKRAAAGRWLEILTAAGIPAELLDGKGHSCPRCGGSDRFAADNDIAERGAVICRGCFAKGGGDGLATVAWIHGSDFPAAVRFVADHLHIDPAGQPQAGNGQRRIVATYDYRDASGNLAYQAVRYEPKDFRQRCPKPGGGWLWTTKGIESLPYRLPELLAADPSRPVVVTEGEKDADNLARLGIVTTTNHGGAGKWTEAHAKHLAGRQVVIIPDADEPGEKHAQAVAASLQGIAASVRIVRLPTGKDASDWLQAGGTPEALAEMIEAAPEWTPAAGPAIGTATPRATVPTVEHFQPYPVDVLPDPLRGFIAAGAESIGCEPSYLALPLLTAAGAAIGTTRRLVLKRGWAACPILWTAIVGESGTSKSPAFRLVMRPVRERQRRVMEEHAEAVREHGSDLARYDRDYTTWKRNKGDSDPPEKPEQPPAARYIVSDTTVEALAPILLVNPRGVILARDELNGWLGSFDRYAKGGKGGGDSAHWLSAYNAESIIVDRKTGTPRTLFVPAAAVSVCGGIQPGILHRALGIEHRESGLAARLLVTCPPRRPKRWTERDIDEATEHIEVMLDRLYSLQPDYADDGSPRPVAIGMSSDAKRIWLQHFKRHAAEQVDLCGELAAAWSKLEEIPARLALILHYAQWRPGDPDQVDARTMAAAVALTDWHKHETRRVYAMLGESDEQAEARRLVEWIDGRRGAVTSRELQQGPRRYRGSINVAEAALDDLVKAGYGTWQDSPTTDKGGRPSRVFLLGNGGNGYETPSKPEENRGCVAVASVATPETQDGEWGEV